MTTVFTDGASSGNPGPGGWGAVIVFGKEITELGGAEKKSTNNRMELRSAIEALRFASAKAEKITICTDSSYVMRGATEWLSKWENSGWKTKTKKEVLNRDMWQELSQILSRAKFLGIKIEWKITGGHIGVSGNERADEIAAGFSLGRKIRLFSGNLHEYEKETLGGKKILNAKHSPELKEKKASKRSRSNTKAFSYISMVDGIIQIHKTWGECEKRVKGVAGARFKKATNPEEEKKIVKEFNRNSAFL